MGCWMSRFFQAHSGELHEPLPSAPCLDVAPLRVVAAAQRSKELGTAAKVSLEAARRISLALWPQFLRTRKPFSESYHP